MRLDLISVIAVEAHLASGRRGIILPLDSLEQLGAPGLIDTASICAQAVADRAAALVGGFAAPVLAFGQA